MADVLHYPVPGCVVEYMEGNAPQIALVTEAAGDKLRLLLPNRRETRLAAARLLPWIGPSLGEVPGREEAVRLLEQHRRQREELVAAVPVLEVWEMAQGEVETAPARWFAELFCDKPDVDHIAAYGRALLACKSHFRFQPPEFSVFSAETVEKRVAEQKARAEREAMIAGGAAFFHLLWEVNIRKRSLPDKNSSEWPDETVAARLRQLLLDRMADPENPEHDTLWQMLAKGLPDVPHLPYQLLVAWGEIPPHHNFWLDRAAYAAGDGWWQDCADEVAALVQQAGQCDLPACDLPFVSIDSATTRDVDDAFFVERQGEDTILTLALACPALCWQFGGQLDRLVLHRATSIYLPEGNCHMLPECLGTDAFSLVADSLRPALCVRVRLGSDAGVRQCEPFLARVRLAANLAYEDAEDVILAREVGSPLPGNAAAAHADVLGAGMRLARDLLAARIRAGAVVMDRPDPEISLEGSGADTRVRIDPPHEARNAQLLVAEMMILASAQMAEWAHERGIPLLHRTQDVTLPREYAGVWTAPHDMARIMRALIPSSLELQARPHAALGMARYSPMTSPLRRYTDLINEAQLVAWLTTGSPRWDGESLSSLLTSLSPVLEATGQVQRFRPRYWKLLYFRQQGDKAWWDGVITEENDSFVTVSLPAQGLFVRGRRNIFGERACPGMAVQVRLGKVHPLHNEIHIIDVVSLEG